MFSRAQAASKPRSRSHGTDDPRSRSHGTDDPRSRSHGTDDDTGEEVTEYKEEEVPRRIRNWAPGKKKEGKYRDSLYHPVLSALRLISGHPHHTNMIMNRKDRVA